jgi:hypothetical protein
MVEDWRDPLSNDPIRRRVRNVHQACHAEIEEVHREVNARRLGDALYIALAIAAYALIQMTPLMGPGGQLDYRCTELPGDNPSHGGCNPPILPTLTFDDEGTVQTNRPEDDEWQPTRRIETINAAIDAVDDFLFSRPDPADWTEEERETFEAVALALERTCDE